MSRQSRKRRHSRRGGARILLVGASTAAVTLVIGALAAVGYVLNVAHHTRDLSERRAHIGGGTSEVYAANGERLGAIQSDELRSPVGWSEIPADLKNATVAIEDQRFYKDDGIDVTGIFRAAGQRPARDRDSNPA